MLRCTLLPNLSKILTKLDFIFLLLNSLIKLFNSIFFVILSFILILLVHIFRFYYRDKKFLNHLRKFLIRKKEIKIQSYESLMEKPLLNIIVPAWNEGESFKECLKCLKNLEYPKKKIIISAGGNQRTIDIANLYSKNDEFKMIEQKKGGGKLKAINHCLKLVEKGIVCIIDSDILLNDDIIKLAFYEILLLNKKIVTFRLKPDKSIQKYDIVKYNYINNFTFFRKKFKRYIYGFASNIFMKFEILNKIDHFSEKKLIDDGKSTSNDLERIGIKTYMFIEKKIPSLTYPINLKNYINQQSRWIENYLYFAWEKDKSRIFKYLLLVSLSFYLFLSPILSLFNGIFIIFSLLILISFYLKIIRKIIFIKKIYDDRFYRLGFKFYLKIIYFLFIDFFINLLVISEILFFKSAYKRRKNIQ